MDDGRYSKVIVNVKAPVLLGQSLGLGGSSGALGCFDKENYIPLFTTPETYPIWSTLKPIILPRHKQYQYKYCIVENGKCKDFEAGDSRSFITEELEVNVRDEFTPSASNGGLEAEAIPGVSPIKPGGGEGGGIITPREDQLIDGRLVIVCYHLPVNIMRTQSTEAPFTVTWAESLIAKSKNSVSDIYDTLWYGTPSIPGATPTEDELEYLRQLLRGMNCFPIYLDPDLAKLAYHGFCKEVLWPTFHNVDQLDCIHAAWHIAHLPHTRRPSSAEAGMAGYRAAAEFASSSSGNSNDEYDPKNENDGIVGGCSCSDGVAAREAAPSPITSPSRVHRVPSSNTATTMATMEGRPPLPISDLPRKPSLSSSPSSSLGNLSLLSPGLSAAAGRKIPSPTPAYIRESSPALEPRPLDWNQSILDEGYAAYTAVTNMFFNTLEHVLRDGDVVWVHDYHLMLLPKMLRDHVKEDISIVFFSHIPFPTSQMFLALPFAADLLTSMTCADLVGFHSFDHARHFLLAAKRMLGIRSFTRPGGLLSLMVKNREVIVSMSHVSIEPEVISEAVNNPFTIALAAKIRAKYPNKKIVVGVDVCQRLSGGALKLAAFEKLLTDGGSIANNVVLIQKSLRPGARVADEATTSADLNKMSRTLNLRFRNPRAITSPTASPSAPPAGDSTRIVVDYEEVPKLSLYERVALWLVADVFLLTSIREGLNLLPMEYLYARKDLPYKGVVITSEFTACASLLSGSLKVNPFYTLHVADTLHRALEMSSKECEQRLQRDLPFVGNHPSSKWTREILLDLKYLRLGRGQLGDFNPLEYLPRELDSHQLLEAYVEAGHVEPAFKVNGNVIKRVLLFDYGGTLIQKEKFDIYIKHTLTAISGQRPTSRMLDAVRRLSEDPQNAVMVITGLTKSKLADVFEGMKNVTLATSNGLVYSWGESLRGPNFQPTTHHIKAHTSNNVDSNSAIMKELQASLQDAERGPWECLDFDIDWHTVRNVAEPIITKFTFRTNGTCVSPRLPGVAWSYFGADPEWGQKQSQQLKVELEAALAKHDVMVTTQIQGSIEIVPRGLHKGYLVKSFFERIFKQQTDDRGNVVLPSFVTILGDEPADDGMFQAYHDVLANTPTNASWENMRAFDISVGKRETYADYYVNDVKAVEEILSLLANSSYADEIISSSSAGVEKLVI